MSDHHLPADPAEWPDDPYALLGVPRSASPRDLKRAYTKLIRVFKPELHPDEFRRIRAAYEHAQRWAPFSTSFPDPGPTPADAPPDPLEPLRSYSRPKSVHEEAGEFWERAIAGDVAGAYHGLAALLDREPGAAELYARLYWLLVLEPVIDPDRAPGEWLTRGIGRATDAGLLFALYRDEVRHTPDEAASDRGLRLTESDRPAGEVAELVGARWDALARVRRWDRIRDDWPVVRARLISADEGGWLGLVVTLVGWVGWNRRDDEASDTAQLAWKEVRALEHLALRFPYWFDQLDHLDATVRSWRAVKPIGPRAADFCRAVRRGWGRPFEEVRPVLERAMQAMSEQPAVWVRLFDSVGPPGYAALGYFDGLMSRYEAEAGIEDICPHSPRRLFADLEDAFADLGRRWPARASILEYCLDECVSPEGIRAAYMSANRPVPEWLVRILDDVVLGIVCRACRLFRA